MRRSRWGAACALLLAWLPATLPAQTRRDAVVTSLTVFAGAPSGLWRSRDWGTSWERVLGSGSGDRLDRIGAVRCILPLGPIVYVGGDAGVFVSLDFGEAWKRVSEQAGCLALLSSRYPQADPTLLLGTAAGLFKSGDEVFLKPEDAPRVFRPAGLTGSAVLRMEWPGPGLVAAGGAGVRVSLDAGASFREAGQGLPEGDVRALAVSSYFAVDPVLFAAVAAQGVFRSSDGGAHWSAAGLAGQRVNDLVWLGPTLFAATDAGLLRSDDLGAHWTPLGQNLSGRKVTRILFPLAPASGLELFVGTDAGVHWSGDGGQFWRPSGLPREEVLALATFPNEIAPRKKGKK